jgi:hypothetical protein
MRPDLGVRQPGRGLPGAVRESAVQAGRRSPKADLALLARVHEALLRLPDSALGQYYYRIAGGCPALPSGPVDAP